LTAVLPTEAEFPYAIRSVSEIMSQNGSTSMAATCSSCLALMDAGVPLKAPVSGIAMGLMMEDGKPYILSDIADAEDFVGDLA
jgi:polyribonucleotide nucleotidyltransferase